VKYSLLKCFLVLTLSGEPECHLQSSACI